MKKAALRLVILAAAATSAGCGDSWPKICQNEMALQHEFNDALMKIVDEDTAKSYKDFYFEKMKTTWENLQKRKEMYVKSKLDNKNLLDEFLREAGLESERRGRPFNMQLADEVLNQWANNEQRKAQIATMKKLMEFVREFSVTLTPNYRSEVAAIVNRRNIQLARIERLIQILQDQGKDAPNLEKVRNAHKTIFTGTNTFG